MYKINKVDMFYVSRHVGHFESDGNTWAYKFLLHCLQENQEDWNDYEQEEEIDYSSLRVQNLQIR